MRNRDDGNNVRPLWDENLKFVWKLRFQIKNLYRECWTIVHPTLKEEPRKFLLMF